MNQELYKNRSVSSCMAEGYKLYLHNNKNLVLSTWKEALATALCFAVLVVLAAQYGSEGYWIKVGAGIAATLVAYIFFKMKMYRSMEENPLKWKLVGVLRRLGFYLSYKLLAAVIALPVVAVVCIPLSLTVYATVSNYLGLLSGDPDGLPAYFPYLLFATAALTMLSLLYLLAWNVLVRCYINGSFKTKNAKKLNNDCYSSTATAPS
ncbi:MAG: hypothetical protein J6I34_05290 [Prevotella sp.]|nr:hypothetical protein [Prevotella sp.]